MATNPHRLEFYVDGSGNDPVRTWLRTELSADKRRSVGAAMRKILQQQGIEVCGSAFGRQLGGGLFEFRLREEGLLVRIFCHAYGARVVLLLAAYDKGRDPSPRRQDQEIGHARARLQEWHTRKS